MNSCTCDGGAFDWHSAKPMAVDGFERLASECYPARCVMYGIVSHVITLCPNFTAFNVPCRGSAKTSTCASKVLHHKDSLAQT